MIAVMTGSPKRWSKNQWALVGFAIFVAVTWNSALYYMSKTTNEPLYSYQGTSGPFAILVKESDAEPVVGEPISSVKAGKVFGWTTTLCIRNGVPALGVTELVRTSPGEPMVVNRVETPIAPDNHRCGPRTIGRLVPIDAPPGYYELQRKLIVAPNGRPLPPISLPSLHIRIEN